MKQIINHSWLSFLFRVLLGGIFLWSGIEKFLHPDVFDKAVLNYQCFA